MKLGFIGLGRMGQLMVKNLVRHRHRVIAYNRSPGPRRIAKKYGATTVASIDELVGKLERPRVVWLMITAGPAVDSVLSQLAPLLDRGDTVIDGGNSFYKDSVRRGKELGSKGVHFLDCGTSGGLEGAERGACCMVGGNPEVFRNVERIFKDLSVREGYALMGPLGSGHYVKMIHNAVEYGMMESMAEGFEMLKSGAYRGKINMYTVAHNWNHGSVVRSWLMELAERAFKNDPELKNYSPVVFDSGEGKWSVQDALEQELPFYTAAAALFSRYRSRQKERFGHKVAAALRHEFGGHAFVRKK
ncbi:decarboxylating 6-phosphogluconate dehydrogenase [Candidatus Woesearchaeota archaeon]|nr:decarboxylating 6-phosphogluconate dehydrogenase [Candidatus Woesearchaeota archaeon]